MNTALDNILDGLRRDVPTQQQRVPLPQLMTSPHYEVPCISMVEYLKRSDKNGIVAEFKRSSPSKGDYRLDSDLAETTRGYMQAGCSGLSILTEPLFFKGSLDDLKLARSQHLCPILRKDFILFPYQVHEARAAGADVILLIASLLDKNRVRDLANMAHDLGMQVLLECHTEEDLDSWISSIQMVGVNSRVATLKTDGLFEAMVKKLPRKRRGWQKVALKAQVTLPFCVNQDTLAFSLGMPSYGQACRTRHVRRWPVSFRLSQHHHEALQHQSMRNDLRSKCDEGFGP